jgi:cytosine/adenosine deaminase-related metal-dependent hydrolase
MRKFSAQYIFTNVGRPLKRGIITTDDNGVIIDIEDTNGLLTEKSSVEFYNGVITPGFVNCHCHLELSYLKGKIDEGKGLGYFIEQVIKQRNSNHDNIKSAAEADKVMFKEGISLCADVCNNDSTFPIKKNSRVKYINLLEVFGLDSAKAQNHIDSIAEMSKTSANLNIPYNFVPHSVYSTSLALFRLLKQIGYANQVTSIHFMETEDEIAMLTSNSGSIASTYSKTGRMPSVLELVKNHADAVLNEITLSGNLILTHNTFITKEILRLVNQRANLFLCLCPASNIYIEEKLPPVYMLKEETENIVIGSDSLAPNKKLSILEELKILQNHFPAISFEELIKWATINGAIALDEKETFGTIELGKNPGLILISNIDMEKMKLKPESFVTRLI